MKRFLSLAMVLVFIFNAGCSVSLIYSPTHKPVPEYLIIEDNDYIMEKHVVCYPEGATIQTADYIFTYSLPHFKDDVYLSGTLNNLMIAYRDELLNIVLLERLALADKVEGAETPYTTITTSVSSACGLINIHVDDNYGFSSERIHKSSCLVIENGKRVGLASISGSYDAHFRAAQQIINFIGVSNPDYFSGLTVADVYDSIDPINGFFVTDTGYTILIPADTIADVGKGELEFQIMRESLYPDPVGSMVSVAQYETVLPAVNMLVTAAASAFSSFGFGIPAAYTATAFIAQLIIENKHDLINGRIFIDSDQFLKLYSSYFDSKFPGIDVTAHDIKVDETGYSLAPVSTYYKCYFVLSDASVNGNLIELIGEIMTGNPDEETPERICGATVVVRLDRSTETGFRFVGITLT